jgi:hypothetical protein
VASSATGTRLTEQHRRAQVANQQSFLRQFLALWPLLNPLDLDAFVPGWLSAVLRLIDVFRQQSADITTDYYRRFREIEAPGDAPDLPEITFQGVSSPATEQILRRVARGDRNIAPVDLDRVLIDWSDARRAAQVSMLVTGPSNIKAKIKRATPVEQATRSALVEASGAASRHVLDGGRKTALTVVQRDEIAIGWARVTDGDPCAFCAMLASRGPAYKSRQQAAFQAHDHCACSVEPVFSRAAEWPGRSREFQQLWNDNIRGQYSGKDAIRAFRRLYEQQQREAQRELEAA